jgi:hypothetical protein
MNLIGALRRTGYSDLKEFQRVEVVVADSARRPGARNLTPSAGPVCRSREMSVWSVKVEQ